MQTIKTEHGTYKISDTRDAAKFMAQIAKPKNPRKRPEKAPARSFPAYIPGKTSVHEYVKRYHEMNGLPGCMVDFPNLPTTPASVYDPAQPLVEVHHD